MTRIPILVEPGTKYFFNETLKRCRITKYKYFSNLFNVSLFVLFTTILGVFLYVNYNDKQNSFLHKQKKKQQEEYVISKIRNVMNQQRKERGERITGLPEFENKIHIQKQFFL